MIDKKGLEMQFLDEVDKLNSRKIFDCYINSCEKFYSDYTDIYNSIFLNKVYNYLKNNREGVSVSMVGGYEEFERGCIVFTPKDMEEALPFSYLYMETNKFQKPLVHKDVLGSLIGLGIKREKIGDILFFENKCYIIILSDIKKIVLDNLTHIGRQKIVIKESDSILEYKVKEKESFSISLASLRLDNFVAGVTNLSRAKVKELIEKELVFINHNQCLNFSKELQKDDIITIRGFGRFYFKGELGVSKKGKIIIRYEK